MPATPDVAPDLPPDSAVDLSPDMAGADLRERLPRPVRRGRCLRARWDVHGRNTPGDVTSTSNFCHVNGVTEKVVIGQGSGNDYTQTVEVRKAAGICSRSRCGAATGPARTSPGRTPPAPPSPRQARLPASLTITCGQRPTTSARWSARARSAHPTRPTAPPAAARKPRASRRMPGGRPMATDLASSPGP